MRLLCDENVPEPLVAALQSAFTVLRVADLRPSAIDAAVLQLASSNNAVLLTFDKDFGELAHSNPDIATPGVVLIRYPILQVLTEPGRIVDVLLSRQDWPDHFSVLQPGRMRMRRLAPHKS